MQQLGETYKEILSELRRAVVSGDAGILFLVAAMGLILSGCFGILQLHAASNGMDFSPYWHANYILMGMLMVLIVGLKYPPFISLMVGGWLTVTAAWTSFGRLLFIGDHIDLASGLVYIAVGLLLVQRSAKK